MRALPLSIGTIHFIGIGGIGMSGIAEVLKNLGYTVQGSDQSESANVKRLRDSGISVAVGHRAENLGDAQVVVYSSAVKPDNPEVVAARSRMIPVVRRAEIRREEVIMTSSGMGQLADLLRQAGAVTKVKPGQAVVRQANGKFGPAFNRKAG